MSSYAQASKTSQQTAKKYITQQQSKVGKARIKSVAQDEIRAREQIHKSRKLFVGSLAIILASMAAIIAFNAFISSAQVRLDIVEQKLNQAVITNQNLNVEKANLSSPERIVNIATHQLHMSVPSSITDLQQVNPYQSSNVKDASVRSHAQKSNGKYDKPAGSKIAKSRHLLAHKGR